jgi:DNA polymerase-1
VENFGFSPDQARKLYEKYHELYAVSDTWVQHKLEEASARGYAELAFGLRLQTPILQQVILSAKRSLPYEAHKEAKTVANAHVQSYSLLNTRAANAFMQRVWKSKYKEQILPIAQIHDSIYLLIRNNLKVLHWVNENLIEEMNWNQLPELQDSRVGLEAKLELYWPDWSKPHVIPNGLSLQQLKEHLVSLKLKKE